MCLVLQFLLNLEGNNQINMSFVRIRCHYITPYLTSSEECELLSRLPDPMSVCSLSLPFFLAFSGFFPPVNTACLVCGTRDLHVSRRPATVRWCPWLCVARSASASAPGIGVVETLIRGKGVSRCRQDVSARLVKELPAKEGQSVTKDVRREG